MDIGAVFQHFLVNFSDDFTLPITLYDSEDNTDASTENHRHDFFELRFLLSPETETPYRLEVVYPFVQHRFLLGSDITYSVTIDLLPEQSRFIYQGIYCRLFSSPYVPEIIDALKRLKNAPDNPKIIRECRMLFSLFFLCADSAEDEFLRDDKLVGFIRLLHEFYYKHDLSISRMAIKAGYSPNYIQRIFKQTTGITPKSYLLQLRMDAAKRFLSEKHYSIKEVAQLCGFNCPHYFSNTFRIYYGYPPSKLLNSGD